MGKRKKRLFLFIVFSFAFLSFYFINASLTGFLISSSISDLPSSENIVLYLPFDGDVLDASGKGYDGMIFGDVDCSVEGKYGKGCLFDGYDDYIAFGLVSGSWMNLSGKSFSISAWAKVGESYSRTIVGLNDLPRSTNIAGITIGNSANYRKFIAHFKNTEGDWQPVRCDNVVPEVGEWYHVVETYDGNNISLYVDGEFCVDREVVGDLKSPRTWYEYDNPWAVGEPKTPTWDSVVDEIIIWDKALSSSEVQALYTFMPEEILPEEEAMNGTEMEGICVEQWECGEWSGCVEERIVRECFEINNCGTNETAPDVMQPCIEGCVEDWTCSEFVGCVDNVRGRSCEDLNACGPTIERPVIEEICTLEEQEIEIMEGEIGLELIEAETIECIFKNVDWTNSQGDIISEAVDGDLVFLSVEAEGCDGRTVDFSIFETDGILGKDSVGIDDGIIENGKIRKSFVVRWEDDSILFGLFSGDPEFVFNAKTNPEGNSGLLNVVIQAEDGDGICGNGILDSNETCDDGNNRSRDGCSNICIEETNFKNDDIWNCSSVGSSCSWIPPIGIPKPSFGIEESHWMYEGQTYTAGGFDYKDAGNGPYTHYVDNSVACSDSNVGGYGDANNPRCDIPEAMPAGSVVEVHGGLTTPYSELYEFISSGTISNPVFIRGADITNRPIILDGKASQVGSYVIFENFRLNNSRIGTSGSNHVGIRNVEIFNGPESNTAMISTGNSNNSVVFNNEIHDNGNLEPNSDENDNHAVKPGRFSVNAWIVDNSLYRVSGDAVQIGGATYPDEERPRFTYVGRNVMHSNRENAVDIKRSYDSIISQNLMYNFIASSTSPGEANIAHDGFVRAWFLYNRISDSYQGITSTGGTGFYLIGNVLTGINEPTFDINDVDEHGAIRMYSTFDAHIIGNVISESDSGIRLVRSGANFTLANNIVSELNSGSYHLVVQGTRTDTTTIASSLFYETDEPLRIYWRGTEFNSVSQFGACTDCLEGDPLFVNQSNDFNLQANSPAIDNGTEAAVYQIFEDRYNISIRFDFNVVPIPQGNGWDIGAYEFDEGNIPVEPYCGDGSIDFDETCDDGNNHSLDGCSSICIEETNFKNDDIWNCSSVGSSCSWIPPIGIPEPEFGIEDTVLMYLLSVGETCVTHPNKCYDFGSGLQPYPTSPSGNPYTHYVDSTHPSSTNSNNPYGTASKPRRAIPSAVLEGSVVEITGGPYDLNTCDGGKTCMNGIGTADKPIFFRGPNASNMPLINDRQILVRNSAYMIIENLNINISSSGMIRMRIDSMRPHHISFRNNNLFGNNANRGGGAAIALQGDYIVVYNNEIHDAGDWITLVENDFNGVSVSGNTLYVWIVDNHIYHMGSDGIGSGHGANYTGTYYYIGRNEIHHNGENAIDLKEIRDFVVSQNKMYGFRDGRDGTVVVVHNGPQLAPINIWFLYNEFYDADRGGLQIGGGSVTRPDDIYVIGNIFHDINRADGEAKAIPSWSSDDITIVGNTIYKTDVGFDLDHGNGQQTIIENNILADMNTNDYIRLFQNRVNAQMNNNLIYDPSGTPVIDGSCVSCILANPQLVDMDNNDLHLLNTSPSIDAGTNILTTLNTVFQQSFGSNVSILVDYDGVLRPQGSGWDIGAFEYVSSSCTPTNGGVEICDGLDNNCDNIVDNGGNNLCDDGISCSSNVCQGVSGCEFTEVHSACQDSLFCNGIEACSIASGGCISGSTQSCSDGFSCSVDSCNEIDRCVNVEDNSFCSGGEICDVNNFAQPTGCGSVSLCEDGDGDGLNEYDLDTCLTGKDLCPGTDINHFVGNTTEFDNFKPDRGNFTISNFTEGNIMNLSDFNIELSGKGRVEFMESVPLVRINKEGCFEKIEFNFDRVMKFEDKKIFINSTNHPGFNKRSRITFFDIGFIEPKLLRDGIDCGGTCGNVTYGGGEYSVDVPGFSTYEIVEGYVAPSSGGGSSSSGGSGGSGISFVSNSNLNDDTLPLDDLGCIEEWVCSGFSVCESGVEIRECSDLSGCGTEERKPELERDCEVELGVEEDKGVVIFYFVIAVVLLVVGLIVVLVIRSRRGRG